MADAMTVLRKWTRPKRLVGRRFDLALHRRRGDGGRRPWLAVPMSLFWRRRRQARALHVAARQRGALTSPASRVPSPALHTTALQVVYRNGAAPALREQRALPTNASPHVGPWTAPQPAIMRIARDTFHTERRRDFVQRPAALVTRHPALRAGPESPRAVSPAVQTFETRRADTVIAVSPPAARPPSSPGTAPIYLRRTFGRAGGTATPSGVFRSTVRHGGVAPGVLVHRRSSAEHHVTHLQTTTTRRNHEDKNDIRTGSGASATPEMQLVFRTRNAPSYGFAAEASARAAGQAAAGQTAGAAAAAAEAPKPAGTGPTAARASGRATTTEIDPALAGRLADDVMRRIEKKMRIHRERHGL